jgi:hypothetical protein
MKGLDRVNKKMYEWSMDQNSVQKEKETPCAALVLSVAIYTS